MDRELNRPKQKQKAVEAFMAEFKHIPIYRKNDNLQCGSGIREYMIRMLDHPKINTEKRTTMVSLYKDLGERSRNAR